MNIRSSVYLRYVANDLRANKTVTTALLLVVTLSAFLMGTGALVMERTLGSVDQLFDEAKPPHFLQMHSGQYDLTALEEFAAGQPGIESWFIEDMLGFDGAAIGWERPSTGESGDFADSLIDNLFVTQNTEFDHLVEESGAIPRPAPGEIYVPVGYQQRYELRVGDELVVGTDAGTEHYVVQGFVRDGQMASSLSPAIRFLISEPDFAALRQAGGGASEIIVEYRMTDLALVGELQRAYDADAAVPKNGPTVTYALARVFNAFSDGLAAMALMLVSLLLIAIALLSVRFVIRGTLEDEVREIGTMKAIGLPSHEISRLYLLRYGAMTVIGCLIGAGAAIAAAHLLTRSVQVNFAPAGFGALSAPVLLAAVGLVAGIVLLTCWRVLRSVKKVEVVNALVHGSLLGERQSARRAKRQARRLHRTSVAGRFGTLNSRLAVADLRAESRQWLLIPVVYFLATVLITLPMSLLNTFQDPGFVTHMGSPEADVRADVQFADDVDAAGAEILAAMTEDHRLTDVQAHANVLYETTGVDGPETLRIAVGDHSAGSAEFLDGRSPGEQEIALSALNADKLGVATGDELTVRNQDDELTLTVSGIYQDITSGGYTAKMPGRVTAGAASYVIFANTTDETDPEAVASEYNATFPDATMWPMQEYLDQLLSSLTDAFRSAAVLSLIFGVAVALLITCLFLRWRLSRDRPVMGALSAIGFSLRELAGQVQGKTVVTASAGIGLGAVFAATAGEWFVGSLIATLPFGLVSLTLLPNPWIAYLAYPLLLLATAYVGAVLLSHSLRRANTSDWLRG
ncbi:FtsX-like permease family protein [Ruania alkalisoli]|uniref:FtsX-like permease family protein n=1 Tax=Ruania alkalisoli TaxID=2779775 RepID=A0A7M1SST1_9MICO|nr:ABC transporter permease [Ruania alkalisoli]QOR70545.1 FtsX-like permease family protein [Ruania alkalisoli]